MLKRAFRVLYWLPLATAFTHYFYTIKTVRGRSMQVGSRVIYSQDHDMWVFTL
jgi:hypothetical protein